MNKQQKESNVAQYQQLNVHNTAENLGWEIEMRNFLVQSLISRSLQLPKNTRPKLSVNFKANKKPERTPKNRLVPCDPAGSRKLSPLGEEHPPKVPRIASIVACTNRHLPHLTKQTQIKTIKVNESQCSQKVNNLSFPYTSPSKENTTQQQLKQNGANPTSLKTALNIKKKKKNATTRVYLFKF